MVTDSPSRAVEIAVADAAVRVVAFLRDWSDVDRTRATAQTLGLEARLTAHHSGARIAFRRAPARSQGNT